MLTTAGIKSTTKDITENEKTFPTLAYATGKANNENQLINSGKKYIILR